jgi:hypothetical protein
MARFLLTPSLYNSWRFWRSAEDAAAARQDFLRTLRREQIPANELMFKGRKLEEDVQKLATGVPDLLLDLEDPSYQDCVQEIASVVEGGLWQERIYHPLRFRLGEFLLYGRLDVIKGPWVYDIKFARHYDIGKYYHSIQHTAYMAGSSQKRFGYLISDGRTVWREDYFWSVEDYQQMLCNLSDMLDDIKRDQEFAQLYTDHWPAHR